MKPHSDPTPMPKWLKFTISVVLIVSIIFAIKGVKIDVAKVAEQERGRVDTAGKVPFDTAKWLQGCEIK